MTTGLFATFPLAVGHELHLQLGRTRAIVLALLGTLCVALVATSALRIDRLLAETTPHLLPDLSVGQRDMPTPEARPATPLIAREAGAEIEALATLVGKKYRISTEATRGLVATAYSEGKRIGVDPLLIIAVIAVESRFNPIAQSDGGAQGLMQVIPAYHKDHFEAAGVDSVLDPNANIRVGARILKDYIRRGGTEMAGLQLYNGSSDDATNAYAAKVLGEKQRLEQVVRRVRERQHTA
jgi:soluble lytic murein transglycosylase-like protein